jgi:hypothetical protein
MLAFKIKILQINIVIFLEWNEEENRYVWEGKRGY